MIRSIRTQMMLFFSLLILTPIIISSVNIYYALQNYLQQSYIRHQSQTMDNLAGELADFRSKLEELSLRIFGDRDIQNFLRSALTANTAEQLDKTTRFRTALQSYTASGIPDLEAFIMKGRGTVYGDGLTNEMELFIRLHLQEADQAAGLPVWSNVPGTDQVALFRQINDNESDLNHTIGYLFIVIKRSDMERIISRYTLDKGQQFAVYDESGSFRLLTGPSLPEEVIRDEAKRLAVSGYETRTYGDSSYVLFSKGLGKWMLVAWIPENLVLEPARDLFFGILFIALVLIFFSVFMVLFLSHRITKPLKNIQRKMKQIGEGRFNLRIPVNREDEVGEVASGLNRMSEEIQSLIRKNQEEEAKRRLIELQTLEYQINPHFLYNTLDSVNMLARKHNDPVIADIVTYLSRLFRIGLNQGREVITVDDEIRHVTYYLKIQEIRFSGMLFWDIQNDESIGSAKMIKFILQPLVENSINHGIRKRDEAGHIFIRVWSDGTTIWLEVEDDGVGMDEEQLSRVLHSLEDWEGDTAKEHGFGLRNVYQRIRLYYGADYGLDISSKKGRGTTVTVWLPFLQQKAERE